eukprot:813930-Rhodomonas_salina.1
MGSICSGAQKVHPDEVGVDDSSADPAKIDKVRLHSHLLLPSSSLFCYLRLSDRAATSAGSKANLFPPREPTPLNDKHVLISARFDGGEKEANARALEKELRERHGINTYIVEAGVGEEFGPMTDYALYNMWLMVAMCFENYGAKTKSKYSSYEELSYASNKNIPTIAIQLCKTFPPEPDDEEGKVDQYGKACRFGAAQNARVFKDHLVRVAWLKPWDVEALASEMALRIRQLMTKDKEKRVGLPKMSLLLSFLLLLLSESHSCSSSFFSVPH